MQTLLVICFIVVFVSLPLVRFICGHLHYIVWYLPQDIYDYFVHKRYNECPAYGYIRVYNGYFGSGKSLSCVSEVIDMYRKYNGLEVYNDDMGVWLKQKVTIVSNLKLYGIPYVQFESEQQFIHYEVAPSEVVIFLIDELGAVWNNRDFKNFNPDVFQNIVQSRHRRISIYGTLPVLIGTDVNVRRYTQVVIFCKKYWRIMKQTYFNGEDVENCSNINMLQPIRTTYKFVDNRMYNQYSTVEMVGKLTREMEEGKLLTFNELNVEDGRSDLKQAKLRKKYKSRQK